MKKRTPLQPSAKQLRALVALVVNHGSTVLLCLVVLMVLPPAATVAAESPPEDARFSDCKGPVSSWRENELAEGGSLAGFLEASRDHQAWLDARGHEVRVTTWMAFEPPAEDAEPGERRAGERVAFGGEIVYPSYDALVKVLSARETERDEAYEAFVQKYRKNTVVKTHRLVCSSK